MVPLRTRAERLLNVYTSWEHLNVNPSFLAFKITPGYCCEKQHLLASFACVVK